MKDRESSALQVWVFILSFVLIWCLCGCSKPAIKPITDPNVIVLTKSEVAIVRAVNVKFRQVDDRMAVIEQILRGDPNNAL
ncbi:MAG: hypothetical protein IMZ53_11420 [Thermoplasmata archaeon]|nr:hypothetical protein [Thermoplasmata archaeon]